MPYHEFAPPPALSGLVECGWAVRIAAGGPMHVQDVLPDTCMDLIWSGHELLVAGPDTRPHPATLAAGEDMVGLRFAAGALPALLGVPAAALRDRRVPLAGLHPRLARRLGTQGPPVDLLTRAALAMPGQGPDRAAHEVVARVAAGSGVAATADALGCTTRTLHRRCLDQFGYGPAVLRRVLRFRRAAALLYAGVAPADAAATAGYADQSHLSREVRALAGKAPGQLASGANRSTPVPSGSSTVA